MTIISEVYKGKIYSGETQLFNTITVEQTGAMQITVKAGVFTHTNGDTWTLENDQVFDLIADPDYTTSVQIEIGDVEPDGIMDVWCGSRVNDGIEEFDIPEGWHKGHNLVYNFEIPAGCTDLTPIDIYVLEVIPGFPDGTSETDWQIKTGGE
jgi:hypothetical protein